MPSRCRNRARTRGLVRRVAPQVRWGIVAVPAERIEIDLVQDYRARSNQLFALQAVDLKDGRACPVEPRKTPSNDVQPPYSAPIIVFEWLTSSRSESPFIHCGLSSSGRTITVAGAPCTESRLCASIVLTLQNRRWACPAGPFPGSRRKGRRRRSTPRR